MLMITCKTCGKAFPSSFDYDKQSFESANLVGRAEISPKCNAVTLCNWEDYFLENYTSQLFFNNFFLGTLQILSSTVFGS